MGTTVSPIARKYGDNKRDDLRPILGSKWLCRSFMLICFGTQAEIELTRTVHVR